MTFDAPASVPLRRRDNAARIAANGREVGAATEGYKNCIDCVENARRNGYVED